MENKVYFKYNSNYIENNTSLKNLSTSTYFSKKEEESEN